MPFGGKNQMTPIPVSYTHLESCALDAVGAKLIRDLKPGEIVVFDKDGVRTIEDHCGKADPSMCVFEYIYFARPDSIIDGHSVHNARLRAGTFLALEHPVQADIVCLLYTSLCRGAS